MPVLARSLTAALAVTALASLAMVERAQAQIPPPPAFVYGSITDEDGLIPEGVTVEAVINNTVCGTDETRHTGEGDSRITYYAIDVAAQGQTDGCGEAGDTIRIRIGDELADGTVQWESGTPIQFDIVFGNVDPAPIPTFTPVPEGAATPTPPSASGQQTPTSGDTPGQGGDNPTDPGNDGNGDNDNDNGDSTPVAGGSGTGTPSGEDGNGNGNSEASATPTLDGELSDTTPGVGGATGGDSDESGGGFPLWGAILLALGGLAAVGGGVGYFVARSNREEEFDDNLYAPPYDGDDVGGEDYDIGEPRSGG